MSEKRKYSDLQVASLIERISDFMASASAEGMTPPMRFRMMMLTMETQFLSSTIGAGRIPRLADYFGNGPLQECFVYIKKIDQLKKNLDRRLSPLLSGAVEDLMDKDFLDKDNNPLGFQQESYRIQLPRMTSSLLWNNERPQRIEQAFYDANVNYADDALADKAADDGYDQRSLMQYKIHNVEAGHGGGIACLKTYHRAVSDAVSNLSNRQIFDDLLEALEELRIVFMEQAHDIHCVRTGDPALRSDTDEQIDFDRCYTELPLSNYYKERDAYRYDVEYDLKHSVLDEWRESHKITGRKLTHEEHISFLTERREAILSRMEKDYQPLWVLRGRSGGLEVEVNADNFARNFYARKGTDPRFFQLEWELEYIDELLAGLQEHPPVSQQEQRTPQERAIDEFSTKLTQLINNCYDQWNGKRCTPAVHQPEVEIVIQKEQMLQFLEQQKESPESLLTYCYPPTGQTNRSFCNYVLLLAEQRYFGDLPKKELAKLLAPIVGLAEGTITNYLSPP